MASQPAPNRPLPPPSDRGRAQVVIARAVSVAGIAGIGAALGAIFDAVNLQSWLAGLVIAVVSLVEVAVLHTQKRL